MQLFLSNAFNDPSDPWYYVIGILFLALVFGALALYMVLDKKFKNRNGDDTNANMPSDGTNDAPERISDGAQTSEISETTADKSNSPNKKKNK